MRPSLRRILNVSLLRSAAASPSAHVTAEAFERILGGLVHNLEAAGKLDGVYLDLHGAAVADFRVVALGQLTHELVRARQRGGMDHGVERRGRVGNGDVLAHAAVDLRR